MQWTQEISASRRGKRWLLFILLAVAIIFLVRLPQPFPHHLTKYDYRAYWGASYLLAHGDAFANPERLFELQQQLTNWKESIPQMTWNPPWLLVWFIPYTWTSFDQSSWLWFLTNFALIFASIVMLCQVYAPESRRATLWLPLLLTFVFMPTLTVLLVGQITSLVLVGLAGFLFFQQRERPFLAGVFLSLTTAKPHLVYLTLPLVLLTLLWQRRWRSLWGFVLPPLLGTVAAFILRPTLLSEYIAAVGYGGLLGRPIPTFSSFLAQTLAIPLLRYVGLLLLPVLLGVWWQRQRGTSWPMPDLVAVTLAPALALGFYGWSFDVLIYLLPMVQCSAWMLENKERRKLSVLIFVLFLLVNGLAWQERAVGGRDDKYWWIPPVLTALYLWTRFGVGQQILARARLRLETELPATP